MKKFLSLALTAVLCAGLLPLTASAAGEWKVTQVIPYQYDEVRDFSEGLAAVNQGGKWGFIDKAGNEVIPCKYNIAPSSFSEGLAAVKQMDTDGNWKYGFINKMGQEVIPCKYDLLGYGGFQGGLAAVWLCGKGWGFIDKTGKGVIPCQYFDASNFSEGLAAVAIDTGEKDKISGQIIKKWGFIDQTGKEVIPIKYDGAEHFSGGLARVTIENKTGYINKTGMEIVSDQYRILQTASDGFILVRMTINAQQYEYTYGFIDVTGREIVSCKYDWAYDFSDGMAAVMLNGKWGFVDKTGTEVIPCEYDGTLGFSGGLARVNQGNNTYLIDKTGQKVASCPYTYLNTFSEGLALIANRERHTGWEETGPTNFGYIDAAGQVVVPCQYFDAHSFSEGMAAVCQNTDGNLTWGFISIQNIVASGTLEGKSRSLDWTCSAAGQVTVSGPLAQGEVVLVATYDQQGRFTGLKRITTETPTAQIDVSAQELRLFWLDANLRPLSPAGTAHK